MNTRFTSLKTNPTDLATVRSQAQAAFTLVEVVIAIVVLVIGISGSILVMTTSLNRSESAENRMQAMHTARNQLERLRSETFSDTTLSIGTHSNTALGLSYVVTVDSSDSNLRNIEVQVPWYDRVRRRTNTLTLNTVFANALHK